MRILIADNHAMLREGGRQLLSEELPSVEFGQAGTTQKTVEQLGKERWELLLLDIFMPGRSGLEGLQKLRQRPLDAGHPETRNRVPELAQECFVGSGLQKSASAHCPRSAELQLCLNRLPASGGAGAPRSFAFRGGGSVRMRPLQNGPALSCIRSPGQTRSLRSIVLSEQYYGIG